VLSGNVKTARTGAVAGSSGEHEWSPCFGCGLHHVLAEDTIVEGLTLTCALAIIQRGTYFCGPEPRVP